MAPKTSLLFTCAVCAYAVRKGGDALDVAPDGVMRCSGFMDPDETLEKWHWWEQPQGQLYRNYRKYCSPDKTYSPSYEMLDTDSKVESAVAACVADSTCKAYIRAAAIYANIHGILEFSLCNNTGCHAFPLGLTGDDNKVGWTEKTQGNSTPGARHKYSDCKMIYERSKRYQNVLPQVRSMSPPREIRPQIVQDLLTFIANYDSDWGFWITGSPTVMAQVVGPNLLGIPVSMVTRDAVCPETVDPTGRNLYVDSDGSKPKYNCVTWVLAIVNCFLKDVKRADIPNLDLLVSDHNEKLGKEWFTVPQRFVWRSRELDW